MILSIFWHCFLGYMVSKSIHFKHRYFTEYLLKKTCWYSKSTKPCRRVFQRKRLLLCDIAILFGKMEVWNLVRNEYSSVPRSLGAALLRIIKNGKIWREGTRPENLLLCANCCPASSEEASPVLPPKIFSREVLEWRSSWFWHPDGRPELYTPAAGLLLTLK